MLFSDSTSMKFLKAGSILGNSNTIDIRMTVTKRTETSADKDGEIGTWRTVGENVNVVQLLGK